MIPRPLLLTCSHALVAALGFALGIYLLPILVAPADPPAAEVSAALDSAEYTGTFQRKLPGSDAFHWAQGRVGVSPTQITFDGKMAPGPDYKIYLTKTFVDTPEAFERIKHEAVRVGEVRSFNRFVAPLAPSVDINDFTTVVVWCERFSRFISATQYRPPGGRMTGPGAEHG